jgi:hypothetical protein
MIIRSLILTLSAFEIFMNCLLPVAEKQIDNPIYSPFFSSSFMIRIRVSVIVAPVCASFHGF